MELVSGSVCVLRRCPRRTSAMGLRELVTHQLPASPVQVVEHDLARHRFRPKDLPASFTCLADFKPHHMGIVQKIKEKLDNKIKNLKSQSQNAAAVKRPRDAAAPAPAALPSRPRASHRAALLYIATDLE